MRSFFLALLIAAIPQMESFAQEPPKLTPEQQEQLKERDALLSEANALENAGKRKEAIATAEKVLKIERGVFGDTHFVVLMSLNWLAAIQNRAEDYAAAKKSWDELFVLREKVFGKGHWTAVNAKLEAEYSALLLGMDAEQRLRVAEANRQNEEVVALYAASKYAEAVPIAERVLKEHRILLKEKHRDTINSLNNLAMLREAQSHFAKAEWLYLDVLRLREELVGKKHPLYAVSLNHLASLYTAQGNYPKTEPLYLETLRIRKELFGDDHLDYANSLNDLGHLYWLQNRLPEAEKLFLDTLRIRKVVLGEKHSDYALSLNNLAAVYDSQGLYSKSEPLYLDALRIRKENFGDKHPEYAKGLSNLGLLYLLQSRLPEAEKLFLDTLRIRKEVLGEKHPDYALSLDSLGCLYDAQGLPAKAEPLYIVALRIRKEGLGENHPSFAGSLSNLGGLYTSLGQYAKAEKMFLDALRIRKGVFGENHPLYALSLYNLASLYELRGQYAEAEVLHLDALRIRKAALGGKHPDYASSLNNLALLYYNQLRYAKAEPYFAQALSIYKEGLGEKHPTYAQGLNNLAFVYQCLGRYAEAEPLFLASLRIRKESLGEKHPDYFHSLMSLGWWHENQAQYAKAEPYYRRAVRAQQVYLEESSTIQSEADQLRHVAVSRFYLDHYLKLPEADAVAQYEAAFRSHGAVTARQMFSRVAERSSPDVRSSIQELREVSRQMNQLVQNPPKAMDKAEQARVIERLDAKRESIEKKLAGQSKEFTAYQTHRKQTSADLQKALPGDTALLDFLFHGDTISAFIVTKTAIRRVALKGGRALHEELAEFLDDQSLGRTRPVRSDGDVSVKLRTRIWEPLEEHLKGITRVLICPDGPLCRLPFAALPGADPKKYLLEERSIVIVPVPQLLPGLLAVEAKKFAGAPTLLAVGDVDFDGDPTAGEHPKKLPPVALTRSGNGLSWKPLPNTKAEVEVIATLFDKLPGAKATRLTRGDATEAALERELGRHRFVHLSTHGFFTPPKMVRQFKDDQSAGGEKILLPTIPPGLSSGIVCAGANKPTFQVSGVITATQIAELDLRNVELAVLSACETSLGELSGGEGVLGLQRAFQMAGARSTITTMWAIPDQSTAELMKRMYSNRLENGLAAAEALREAQLWVLNNGEKVGAFPEKQREGKRTPPKYWAAFTFAGDWR